MTFRGMTGIIKEGDKERMKKKYRNKRKQVKREINKIQKGDRKEDGKGDEGAIRNEGKEIDGKGSDLYLVESRGARGG